MGRDSIAIAIPIAIPIAIAIAILPDGFTLWVNADRTTTTLQRSEASTTSPPTGSREPTIRDRRLQIGIAIAIGIAIGPLPLGHGSDR